MYLYIIAETQLVDKRGLLHTFFPPNIWISPTYCTIYEGINIGMELIIISSFWSKHEEKKKTFNERYIKIQN